MAAAESIASEATVDTELSVFLNHAEMVHLPGPGQHDAARAFFEVIGFSVADFGPWLRVLIDPTKPDGGDTVMYANEVTAAQQKFEVLLQGAIGRDPELASAMEHWNEVRLSHPQFGFHIGASIATREDWEARIERVREARRSHPLLAGKIDVLVLEPGHPAALGPVPQAFVHTDIVASGLLSLGLIFELQLRPEPGVVDIDALANFDFPLPSSFE
jgi:hypothetical protein